MKKPDNERVERIKGKLDSEVAEIQAPRKKRAAAKLATDEGLGQKVSSAKVGTAAKTSRGAQGRGPDFQGGFGPYSFNKRYKGKGVDRQLGA